MELYLCEQKVKHKNPAGSSLPWQVPRPARSSCDERPPQPAAVSPPAPPSSGNFLQDLGLRLLGYHNWPIGYVARHYETRLDAGGSPMLPSHSELPRGTVFKVP